MRHLVFPAGTRRLRLRTRLAPGSDPWAPHHLLVEVHSGSSPHAAVTLDFTDADDLRWFVQSLRDLLRDARTYLPLAEHRFIRTERIR